MKQHKNRYLVMGALGAALAVLLAVSLACAAEETATPAAPATPVPPVAPTAAPAPTIAPAPTAVVKAGPQRGGVLRFGTRPLAELGTLDGHYRKNYGEYWIDYSLYDNLVVLDADGNIQPELAKSWETSADGKTVTFKLEAGIKFQDGTDFNAEAVKWNMDRLMDPEVQSTARLSFLALESVEVVDDSTVRFHLSKPWRPLLAALTLQGGWMSSPTAVMKYDSYADRQGDYGKNPTGTGPFKLREWKPGDIVVIDRNPNYWKEGRPYLDGIVYIGAASEVRMTLVRTGEAHLMEPSPFAMRDLRLVENNPEIKIIGQPSGRHHWVELDTNWGPLQNKKVRQAIGFALDREAAVDVIFDGRGRPAYGPEGSGWWAYDPEEFKQIMHYDPQRSKALLAEAGYPDGLTLPMWCRSDGEAEKAFCEFWQSMMASVGITIDMTMVPYADVKVARNEGVVHMESLWYTPRGDPHARFGAQYHSTGVANYARFKNAEMDRLIEEAATIFDLAKAADLYAKAQRLAMEESPRIYTAHPDAYVVARKNVQDFVYAADLIIRLRDLWLSQ